jgi:hypothetical protein
MDDLLIFIIFSSMIRASDARRFHLGEKQSLSFSAVSGFVPSRFGSIWAPVRDKNRSIGRGAKQKAVFLAPR